MVKEVRNDKRAKNLHLDLHREVAIPPHMGTCMASINLLLQVGLKVDNASQILEKLH
jgi:hypothetical protein